MSEHRLVQARGADDAGRAQAQLTMYVTTAKRTATAATIGSAIATPLTPLLCGWLGAHSSVVVGTVTICLDAADISAAGKPGRVPPSTSGPSVAEPASKSAPGTCRGRCIVLGRFRRVRARRLEVVVREGDVRVVQ